MFLYASLCDASGFDEGRWTDMYHGRDAPYVCNYRDAGPALYFTGPLAKMMRWAPMAKILELTFDHMFLNNIISSIERLKM